MSYNNSPFTNNRFTLDENTDLRNILPVVRNSEQFVGIADLYKPHTNETERKHTIECIRNAFKKHEFFSVCPFHDLKSYNFRTFSKDVQEYHVKDFSDMTDKEIQYLKKYCVNYFLCPNADSEEELEACYREVFPKEEEKHKNHWPIIIFVISTIILIFCYSIFCR